MPHVKPCIVNNQTLISGTTLSAHSLYLYRWDCFKLLSYKGLLSTEPKYIYTRISKRETKGKKRNSVFVSFFGNRSGCNQHPSVTGFPVKRIRMLTMLCFSFLSFIPNICINFTFFFLCMPYLMFFLLLILQQYMRLWVARCYHHFVSIILIFKPFTNVKFFWVRQ